MHLEDNSKLLSERVLLNRELPIINALYFRFNSYGELINELHYINLVKICIKNPKTTFALWTKRLDIIKGFNTPDNLILIYSNPNINIRNSIWIPKGFDKMFIVYTKEYLKDMPESFINCGGRDCLGCLKCYTKNDIKIIKEKLK